MKNCFVALIWVSSLLSLGACATPAKTGQTNVPAAPSSASSSAVTLPKFATQATRLFQDPSYVRKSKAPDFWAMMPYYLPQRTGASCSVASVVMVLNAARVHDDLKSTDELATEEGLLKRVTGSGWTHGMQGGPVTLDQLAQAARDSFKLFGFESVQVETIHADDPGAAEKFHHQLLANEKSDEDFIVANFIQGVLTGDPEGGGHVAPIAAFDAKSGRVLIFDPDRAYYEPYWVSEKTLFNAMNTKDSDSGRARGWIWIKKGKRS